MLGSEAFTLYAGEYPQAAMAEALQHYIQRVEHDPDLPLHTVADGVLELTRSLSSDAQRRSNERQAAEQATAVVGQGAEGTGAAQYTDAAAGGGSGTGTGVTDAGAIQWSNTAAADVRHDDTQAWDPHV